MYLHNLSVDDLLHHHVTHSDFHCSAITDLDLKVKQYGFSGAVKCLILYFFENDVSANNMTDRGSVDQLRGNSLFINDHIGRKQNI